MTIRVTFDRVGKDHEVPPLLVDSHDPHVVAGAIYREIKDRLRSELFSVNLDMEGMSGSIENGAFGRFLLTEVA